MTVTLPAHAQPRASIVVLCRRDAQQLRACLEALAHNGGPGVAFELILLLNGAEAEVTDFCERELVGARVDRVDENLGFPAGVNRAAAQARGDYLVLLNDDTEVEPGWLEALVDTADEQPRAGAIGSRVLFGDGSLQEAGGVVWSDGTTAQVGRGLAPGSLRYLYRRRVDYCSAASLLVRQSTWEAVGGFDEGYFPGYYEDVHLCMSIGELGQEVVYEPRSRLVHHESGSLEGGPRARAVERNLRRLQSTWSSRLADQETGGPVTPARVEYAAFRAEGLSRRILLVDPDPPAETVGELRSIPAAIALHAKRPLEDPEHLGELGCDIVEAGLDGHLSTPEVLYDAVVLRAGWDLPDQLDAIREHQPQAAVVCVRRGSEPLGDAAAGADLIVSGQAGTWAGAIAEAKSRRVHEYA